MVTVTYQTIISFYSDITRQDEMFEMFDTI